MDWLKHKILGPERLEFLDVLYEYDGPFIFTTKIFGLFSLACRLNDPKAHELYAVCPTNPKIVSSIKSGALSIRGGLLQPGGWIVELGEDGRVDDIWAVTPSEMPQNYLPRSGVGLHPGMVNLPDAFSEHLERQTQAIISLAYKGERLHSGEMPFLVFKNLLDDLYKGIRGIYSGHAKDKDGNEVGDRRLDKMIDIPIWQPQFSSLIVRIGSPEINPSAIEKYSKDDLVAVQQSLDQAPKLFQQEAASVVKNASEKNAPRTWAKQHERSLALLDSLAPKIDGPTETLEIYFFDNGIATQKLEIDSDTGQRISEAYNLISSKTKEVMGSVIEINFKRNTFLIEYNGDRELTCNVDFLNISADLAGLKKRDTIKASGRFWERTRRDYIYVSVLDFGGKRYVRPDS